MFKHLRLTLVIVAGIAAATFVLRREMKELPNLPQVKFWEPALGSKLFDRNGELIFEYAIEKRDYVPLSSVPKHTVDAVLAIEDNDFYKHWGINLSAIGRAMLVNFRKGRVVQGGSTLTMQLAKNLFLNREKSIKRKLRELLFVLYIESTLSKNEILEMYINQVYLGHGIYGIAEGARGFFGKRIEDLDVAESAMLAGLVKAPSNYSPRRFPDVAKQRAATVLTRMKDSQLITDSVYKDAQRFEYAIVQSTEARLPAPYAHFIEYVRQDIEERYSAELLWKGGLNIYSTLDKKYQKIAYDAMTGALEGFDAERLKWEKSKQCAEVSTRPVTQVEGAFLLVEAKTGSILAWLGGRDFKTSQFNRVYQSKRQPGSSIKPFVWLAALEAGATPSTLYDDLPMAYYYDKRNWKLIPGSTDFYHIAQATATMTPETVWVPDNFDGKYLGRITLRRALALSRNLVSLRIVEQVGASVVAAIAKRAGVRSRLEAVPSLGLGTSEVTLLDLVRAYGTFANLGVEAAPFSVTQITEGASAEVLEENNPSLSVALSPVNTYILVDMMKDVVRPGGTAGSIGRAIAHPMAGKTGTTQDNRDLWFVGFTPELTAAGWMGYDNFDSFGRRNMTAGMTVAPWWTSIMKEVLKDYPKRDFGPPPDGVIFQKICKISGSLARPSCPKVRLEVFRKGTEPRQFCQLESHEQEALTKPELTATPESQDNGTDHGSDQEPAQGAVEVIQGVQHEEQSTEH